MSKETKGQLSDEFKKDIRENHSSKNILGTVLALLAVFLVFGTIGVAGYELVFKPEKTQQKSASEKIESRPAEVVETPKAEVAAPTTEAPAATTPAATTTATSTDYTVVSGDSYSSIANANSMSSADLMKYNGATSEDLQIGQVIKIPSR